MAVWALNHVTGFMAHPSAWRPNEASFSALATLGNARAERDHHPVLEVLDREASFFSFFSPHPEVPLLSIAIDGRLSTSAATR
jgi:hypothetical protein